MNGICRVFLAVCNMSLTAVFVIALVLLARMIMKRELAPFFFVGYFIVAYSGISTTGVALFSILIMILYFTMNKDKLTENAVLARADGTGGDFDEF